MDYSKRRMDDYEKIRIVGKGAFGTAILYRRKSIDRLVVLKEINITELSSEERQMALNEVEVLSSLNHPNIIGYMGSFVENGMLMIEMEYADGGTLNQLLNNREVHLPEREILNYLQQISSAIAHMHSNNILHRDLKTANVFLNSDGSVKIGDFGISKVLSSHVQAQTVLGTPYYISPEMCEGKEYGEKSDIWAMGCILYEMCCLHRAFQASSLSALVNKIMKGNYKPIPSGYTKELANLINLMLDKDPEHRPAAKDIIDIWTPIILTSLGKSGCVYVHKDQEQSSKQDSNATKTRSVLYEMKSFKNDFDIHPIELPPKVKIIDVTTGENHFIAISDNNIVLTWGEGMKGQLGLGEFEKYKRHPIPVMTLLNKNIIMSRAGKDFSIFLSSDGTVWSCGNGSFGALGHGDWENCFEPKIIEKLTAFHISKIETGTDHVAALADDGTIFTWGCGNMGQTGQGILDDCCTPIWITPFTNHQIQSLHLGYKATMAITIEGKLLACGFNVKNKLGVHKRYSFSKNKQSLFITTLQKVKYVKGTIINCSIGNSHSALLIRTNNGQTSVYTLGHPCKDIEMSISEEAFVYYPPRKIAELDGYEIKYLSCGPTYTTIGTVDNCILFWGIRYDFINIDDSPNSQATSGFWSRSSVPVSQSSSQTSLITSSALTSFISTSEIIKDPIPILALYASQIQLNEGSYMLLEGIYPLQYSILFLIKTTVPLVKTSKKTIKNDKRDNSDDCDTIGPIPTWMKADIAQSQHAWRE